MSRVVIIIVLALTLSGCGPTVIVMKNPTTGALVECRGGATPGLIAEQVAAKDCANGYQAAGWIRMN